MRNATNINIDARSFPAIAIVLGFLMLVANIVTGWVFVGIGAVSQGIWLLTTRR